MYLILDLKWQLNHGVHQIEFRVGADVIQLGTKTFLAAIEITTETPLTPYTSLSLALYALNIEASQLVPESTL